jgi:hypothetical protein
LAKWNLSIECNESAGSWVKTTTARDGLVLAIPGSELRTPTTAADRLLANREKFSSDAREKFADLVGECSAAELLAMDVLCAVVLRVTKDQYYESLWRSEGARLLRKWHPVCVNLPTTGEADVWPETLGLREHEAKTLVHTREQVATSSRRLSGLLSTTLEVADVALALALVSSRACYVPVERSVRGTMALVPVLDCANHEAGPEVVRCGFDADANEYRVSMVEGETLAAGAEVSFSYGRHSNWDLYVLYGFVIPNSPDDGVSLEDAAWPFVADLPGDDAEDPKGFLASIYLTAYMGNIVRPSTFAIGIDGELSWTIYTLAVLRVLTRAEVAAGVDKQLLLDSYPLTKLTRHHLIPRVIASIIDTVESSYPPSGPTAAADPTDSTTPPYVTLVAEQRRLLSKCRNHYDLSL